MAGLLFVRRGAAVASTLSTPAAGSQYDGGTFRWSGTGFSPATNVITIDGVDYVASYVDSTHIDVAIDGAEVATSPFLTAGTKTVSCNTGGTANWTVDAWDAETSFRGLSELYASDAADCSGAGNATQFSPWVGRKALANATQGGATKPARYTGVAQPTFFNALDCVFMQIGFTTASGAIGGSHYAIATEINFSGDLNAGRHFLTLVGGGARLYCPSNGVLRWEVVNGTTVSLDVTPSLSTPMVVMMSSNGTATELRINVGTTAGVDYATAAAKTLATGTNAWHIGSSDGAGTDNIGHLVRRMWWSRDVALTSSELKQLARSSMKGGGII